VKRFAVLWVLIAAMGCGKVGPPLPPIVRTPQQVADLKVAQNGDKVVLSWTNPAVYVDSNPATDISSVRILQNGVVVATQPAKGAGQRQTAEIDISRSLLGSDLSFAVVVGTERGKSSPASNPAGIIPQEVPGSPRGLTATLDQLRIILDWEAPERNADLANVYLVSRSDRPETLVVMGRHFEDPEYEQDKVYTYTVTAAVSRENGPVPGLTGVSVRVTAKDTTKPATPSGLTFQSLEPGLLLQWAPNKERDLKEYLVFRSDQSEPICRGPAEICQDRDYRPGLTYRLFAEDRFGNRSPESAPIAGP
jgi:hypothetical protein